VGKLARPTSDVFPFEKVDILDERDNVVWNLPDELANFIDRTGSITIGKGNVEEINVHQYSELVDAFAKVSEQLRMIKEELNQTHDEMDLYVHKYNELVDASAKVSEQHRMSNDVLNRTCFEMDFIKEEIETVAEQKFKEVPRLADEVHSQPETGATTLRSCLFFFVSCLLRGGWQQLRKKNTESLFFLFVIS